MGMGICVANVSLRSTGMVLSHAYLALAQNSLHVKPTGNSTFQVQSMYNTWFNESTRRANCSPVDTNLLYFTWASANTDSKSMYTAGYAALKVKYPQATDA